ncbi:MAG: nitroreductase, partial [Clostridia bacterium]|nr:nitroreductase [Clostridia bacterium]
MTIMQAMEARHSVRAYKDEPIPAEIRQKLDTLAEECSREKG